MHQSDPQSTPKATESAFQRVVRHSRWLLFAQVVACVTAFVQAMILTRALGADRYGVFVLATASTATVFCMFNSRIWQSIARFTTEFRTHGEFDKATGVIQLCLLIEALAVVFACGMALHCADYVQAIYPDVDTRLIFMTVVIAAATALAEPLRAVVRLADGFGQLSLHSLGVSFVQCGVLISLWLTQTATISSVLLVQGVVASLSLTSVVFMAGSASKQLNLQLTQLAALRSLKHDWLRIVRFTALTNITATASIIHSLDRLILGTCVSPADVGAYDLARRLVSQLERLIKPVNRATFQELAQLVAESRFDHLRQLQIRLTRHIAAWCLPVCCVITIAAPFAIPVVFGTDFAGVGGILSVLIWQLARQPLAWFRGYMLATDRIAQITMLTVAHAILLLLLMLLLVPVLGIIGAAWAAVTGTGCWITTVCVILFRTDLRRLAVSNGDCQSTASASVRSAA